MKIEVSDEQYTLNFKIVSLIFRTFVFGLYLNKNVTKMYVKLQNLVVQLIFLLPFFLQCFRE